MDASVEDSDALRVVNVLGGAYLTKGVVVCLICFIVHDLWSSVFQCFGLALLSCAFFCMLAVACLCRPGPVHC